MFIAAVCTEAKPWRPPECLSIADWIKKMWYLIYTIECFSATRKDEILPSVMTRMDLENVMLSKISQSEKAKDHMTSPICGT